MQPPSAPQDEHDWDVTSGVGCTALGVAAARAADTSRPGGICTDPYAASLVAAADASVALPTRLPTAGQDGWDEQLAWLWHALTVHLGLRTRFFDEQLTRATRTGVRQVVILAAGLDTRAHRLEWPAGTRVFELDQHPVLTFKDRVLTEQGVDPACDRCAVGIDLRQDWPAALVQAGFTPRQPTVWLAEGLLPYLPETAERALFHRITRLSAPGSHLELNDSSSITAAQRDSHWNRLVDCFGLDPATITHSEPTRPEPHEWFRDHDWHARARTGEQLAERYDPFLPAELLEVFAGRSRYCTAHLPQEQEGST